MPDMSRNCTLFTTSKPDEDLAKVIIAEQNRAIGSGGYAIDRASEKPGDAIDLSFSQLDYHNSPKSHAFIKGGKIWTTHMSGWLMDVLKRNNVRFKVKEVATPSFIARYMEGLITTDQQRKRRYG